MISPGHLRRDRPRRDSDRAPGHAHARVLRAVDRRCAVTAEELVEESFEFLLAREPNTSILSEFDLKGINKYFSGYEQEMQRKFQPK
jgi:hypothetical protein